MISVAFQSNRISRLSSIALQQKRAAGKLDIAIANAERGSANRLYVCEARGIFYGVIISFPLWMIIGGTFALARQVIG